MPTHQSSTTGDSILFTQGFRIFFLLAGIWSIIAMIAWLLILWTPPTNLETYLPLPWQHGHEMLFGFVTAAAAGFLLTATPVWSKTPPLTGGPLKALALLWILSRLGTILAGYLPTWLLALVDLMFFIGFLAFLAPTLWFTGNRVHRIFPILLGLLAMGDVLVHLETLAWTQSTAHRGLLLGLNAIIFFLVMTGGHIMPMFTKDALKAQGMGFSFAISPTLEIVSAVSLTLLMLADLFFPNWTEAGWFFLAAGIIQGIRLSRWHGLKTLQTPLLWVLHLGYLWLVIGLILRGLARLTGILDESAALHALNIGAMGLFTLGIMSRISLTHTKRSLQLPKIMTSAFLLITIAAFIRVFLYTWQVEWAIWLSGMLWIAAYMIFCMVFLPILTTPEPHEQTEK